VLEADPFTFGVASGDPDATSVVLWTRLAGDLPDEGLPVSWFANDAAGTEVASGVFTTGEALGGTVHVVAEIDQPVTYGFTAGGWESTLGSTAALIATNELRVVSASCQHYEAGFYAAHRDIAEWAPDLVLFLGDFIYEGDASPVTDGRVRAHEGPEPKTLDAYRARYAPYLSAPHLQATRAAAPWMCIWDDHEVENNYAGIVPQDTTEADAFAARRAVGYQVWWENTPTRLPPPNGEADYVIYRGVDVAATDGTDLVRVSALDGRQFRDDQVCDLTLDTGPPCDGWDDPDRTMLGSEQEAWVAERFASSSARWNCLAQQTVLLDFRFPGTGAILNYDQWDGYSPARDRLLADAPNVLIVLTGDIHLGGVGLLGPADARSGIEFICTSISSTANVPPEFAEVVNGFDTVFAAELTKRGCIRHTITPDAWTAEYRIVDDIADADSAVSTWKTFRVDHGTSAVTEV
jgi:alkaline phosphatase D